MLYCWYGDDFTGSTDVLEQLALGGVPAVLFLGITTVEEIAACLDQYPGVRAVGVAGDSRSRGPEWMGRELPKVFAELKALGAEVVHYKVCSTFDSAPERGSIGRAIETGLDVFGGDYVPVVVGAMHLRRYVAFGQLFAAGPDGNVVRIDRHPMARHPATPMREADLRQHLEAQTTTRTGLVDLTSISAESVQREVAAGARAIVFDAVDEAMQRTVGELVWGARPVFAVGSSGLTAGLVSAWGFAEKVPWAKACDGPLLVVSGSCAEMTARQIRWGLENGFAGVEVQPGRVKDGLEAAARLLGEGRDVVVYTALGEASGQGVEVGGELGLLVHELQGRAGVGRVVFCGGDSASYAMQELGVRSLRFAGRLAVGVPLCVSDGGLEVVLKGGQVGGEDFFGVVRDGLEGAIT